MVTRSVDASSRTLTDWGSFPSATTRTAMSRSVTVPTNRPSSTIGTIPTSSCFMILAASTTELPASMPVGLEVITSCTLFPIEGPPLSLWRHNRLPRLGNSETVRMSYAHGHPRAADHRARALVPRVLRGPAMGRLPGVQGGCEQGLRLGTGRGRSGARDGQADRGGARDRAPAALRAHRELRGPLRLGDRRGNGRGLARGRAGVAPGELLAQVPRGAEGCRRGRRLGHVPGLTPTSLTAPITLQRFSVLYHDRSRGFDLETVPLATTGV